MAVASARPDESSSQIADLVARIDELERAQRMLNERVRRLDDLAAAGGMSARSIATDTAPWGSRERDGSARVVAYTGQALIALGIGYLLRAITEAALVPPGVGIALGLAYAIAWIGVAVARERRGNPLASRFAGALTPLLAFPLISEAALRFHLWPSEGALFALAAVTAASFATAVVNNQQSIAWIASLGAGGTAAVLMVSMRAYVGAEVFFVAFGIATLWLGYQREWTGLRWPAALVADALAVVLVLRALNPNAGESPHAVMAVLLLLMAAYPASIIIRTVVMNRDVVLFEIVQCIALLLLLRGALLLSPVIGSARLLLGSSVLGIGIAVSAAAVAFAHRSRASTLNAHFYATVGTVLLMVGGAILLDGVSLAAFWAVGAIALAMVALRPGRATFMAHATTLAIAAAWPAELLPYATRALTGSGPAMIGWPSLPTVMVCVLLAALACIVLRPQDARTRALRRTAALFVSAAVLWSVSGLAAGAGMTMAAGMFAVVSASKIATIRTIVLSLAACAATGAGRFPALTMAGWLSYPILFVVALKLVAEDLRVDRPFALFVALGVYGAALIISARLGRRPPS